MSSTAGFTVDGGFNGVKFHASGGPPGRPLHATSSQGLELHGWVEPTSTFMWALSFRPIRNSYSQREVSSVFTHGGPSVLNLKPRHARNSPSTGSLNSNIDGDSSLTKNLGRHSVAVPLKSTWMQDELEIFDPRVNPYHSTKYVGYNFLQKLSKNSWRANWWWNQAIGKRDIRLIQV